MLHLFTGDVFDPIYSCVCVRSDIIRASGFVSCVFNPITHWKQPWELEVGLVLGIKPNGRCYPHQGNNSMMYLYCSNAYSVLVRGALTLFRIC